MYNILICDDEPDILNALDIYLTRAGYSVIKASNGEEVLNAAKNNEIHLIIMDVMMPGMDGISATVRLREISNVPVIMLTAKSEDSDKVIGLNVGADDYVTKPFNPDELLARVRSQLRRYTDLGGINSLQSVMRLGGIEMDDSQKKVKADGNNINLTPIEYSILKLLMTNPNRVFSSREIYRRVWNDAPIGNESTVTVHIRHLREKVEINPAEPKYLKVVWGQGYKFEIN